MEQVIYDKREFVPGLLGGFRGHLTDIGGGVVGAATPMELTQFQQPDFPNVATLSVGGRPLFPSAQTYLESAMSLYAPDLPPTLRSNVVGNVRDEFAAEVFSTPRASIEGRVTGPIQVLRRIAEDWALSEDELATLLDYSNGQEVDDLFSGRLSLRGADREDRLRMLFGIYRFTSRLFVDANGQRAWLRTSNPMLKGQTPLEAMLNKRIPGMVRVRNLVDRIVGR